MSVPIIFKHRKYIQLIKELFENIKRRRVERDIRKCEQLISQRNESIRRKFLSTPINKILCNEIV